MSAAAARVVSIGLVLGCVAVPAAAAPAVDRVQVGRPGQEVTVGFPRETSVSVTPLPGYRAVEAFDGNSRTWRGPAFSGGSTRLEWRVTFHAAPTSTVAARRALGREAWPVVREGRLRVPHRVGSVTVGSIPAAALLTEAPDENDARVTAVVAFPLCHGLFVAATFSATSPAEEYESSPSDPIRVRGVPAGQWNRARALDALGQVAVDGYLPVSRVTARSNGRSIHGVVRDCRRHAMAGIGVRLHRAGTVVARTRASADGSYRFIAPGPGSYRITVPLSVTR